MQSTAVEMKGRSEILVGFTEDYNIKVLKYMTANIYKK